MATRKRRLNIDKARKKQEELDARGENAFHELKTGANMFYLMPPWSDEVDEIWKEVQQHGMLVCPASVTGKTCVLCEENARRARKGDVDFQDKFRKRSRAFFNAIPKAAIKERDPANVKVLAVSGGVFQDIIDYISDEDIDPSDPKASIPICIRRRGKGLATRYKVTFGDPVDISRYLTPDVLGAVYDLDTLRAAQPSTDKEMRKAIREFLGDGGDDDDEETMADEEEFEDIDDEDEELLQEPDDDEGDEDLDEELEDEVEEEEEEEIDDGDEEAEEDVEEEFEDIEEPEPPKRRAKRPATKKKATSKRAAKPAAKRRAREEAPARRRTKRRRRG